MPSPSATNAPVCGMSCSGVAVATIEEVDRVGGETGVLDGGGARFDGEAGGGLTVRRDPALTDAGALDDPLVRRVDALLELGVGEPLLGEGGAPSGDAGAHPQATRSQATG